MAVRITSKTYFCSECDKLYVNERSGIHPPNQEARRTGAVRSLVRRPAGGIIAQTARDTGPGNRPYQI